MISRCCRDVSGFQDKCLSRDTCLGVNTLLEAIIMDGKIYKKRDGSND